MLPRILNGSFDYENNKAIWPSTGNYCRGGVAISRILGLKSVAILPEGMSKERFEWLEKWIEDKNDIIKTNFDHRIAMSMLIFGLAAEKSITIDDPSMIKTSFPKFKETMNTINASIKNVSK